MTTHTNTAQNTQVDAAYETSKFALGTAVVTAALIGLWACSCMISTLMNNGIAQTLKGLLGTMV